jgi:uncharacterized phage-associated protein
MNARDVAEFLLRLSDTEANDITNLKLQKLVYYVQGFHLAMHGATAFNEPIEAWAYGPVVPDLYHAYKGFGRQVIDPTKDYSFTSEITTEQQELIREVYQVYGQYSGIKLMDLTHEERPWMEADKPNGLLDPEVMRAYFTSQLN